MDYKQTLQALDTFAKNVVKQSRANLTRKKKNVTSDLYGSLGYDLKVNPNSFSLEFYMSEYGAFVDEGVRGAKSTYNESSQSRFSYTNKRPPSQPLADWAKAKNIRLRDDKGRFKKGNYKSIGYVLAKSIFEKGIKASFFFTKPFEQNFDKLPNALVDKFALDIDDLIQFTQ
tara:strand:+ start:1067 stop:1582 length:516 start_codon:yes stop_codon:yes gene_type:complete